MVINVNYIKGYKDLIIYIIRMEEIPDIEIKEGQKLEFDHENNYWVKYGKKEGSTGSWGSPVLKCPKCKKWMTHLGQHSKTIKCKFDFESVFKFREKHNKNKQNII
jgi:hypothetical protein